MLFLITHNLSKKNVENHFEEQQIITIKLVLIRSYCRFQNE